MQYILSVFLLFSAVLQAQSPTHSDAISIVENWNRANNTKDPYTLSQLYADTLTYYGRRLSRSQCIRDKKRFFRNYPSFHQEIGAVHTEAVTPRRYMVSFDKTVKLTRNGSEKSYPSYLLIDFSASSARIIEEGDRITDANLAKRKVKENHKTVYAFNGKYTISGRITKVPYYGPPGYGDDPAHDQKLTAYILKLETPVTVVSDGSRNTLNETTTASEVQLVIHNLAALKKLMKEHRKITVRGEFFSAHTGYHIRDLLMDVTSFK